MQFPEITRWSEGRMKLTEKMIVLQHFRFNKDGKILKKKPGDEIELEGELKKDLYHQLKVCYPADYEKLKKYFESQRKSGLAVERQVPGQVVKAEDVESLQKQVDELVKVVKEQQATIEELKSGKSKGGK